MSIGIYKITNKINNLSYIGQSMNIEERWKHHKRFPINHSHYPLYKAFEEFGIENFDFSILEICPISDLNNKEIFYINKFNSYYNGYNQTKGGSNAGHVVKISDEDLTIIYDLLQNSNLSQNDIAKIFDIGIDTVSEINHGKTRLLEGYSYPLRNNKKQYYCIDCGVQLKYNTMRCRKCKGLQDRIVKNRPNRKELKQLIRTMPFTKIGEKFGVSDNSIRKWCLDEKLPFKKSEIKKISDEEWDKL